MLTSVMSSSFASSHSGVKENFCGWSLDADINSVNLFCKNLAALSTFSRLYVVAMLTARWRY